MRWRASLILGPISGAVILALTVCPRVGQAKPTALVISGGGNPSGNFCRYYENVSRVQSVFAQWDKINVVADGPGQSDANMVACDALGFTQRDEMGRPLFVRREPEGGNAAEATEAGISKVLEERVKTLTATEPVLIYFTDHGASGGGPGSREVLLWGEKLKVSQLRDLLAKIPTQNRVILVNDQCFGGGMLEALWSEGLSEMRPNACGFSSAQASEFSYSGGGFMIKAEALFKLSAAAPGNKADIDQDLQYSFAEVFQTQKLDRRQLSNPVRSSDLFLSRYLERQENPVLADAREIVLKQCLLRPFSQSLFPREMSVAISVLFRSRLSALQEELLQQAVDAGVSLATPYGAVVKQLQAMEAGVAESEEALVRAKGQMKEALMAWLKAQGDPALFRGYDESRAALKSLRKSLLSCKPKECTAIQERMQRAKGEAISQSGQIGAYLDAVMSAPSPSFDAFVKSNGGPKALFPPDIRDRVINSRNRFKSMNANTAALRRYVNTLRASNALLTIRAKGERRGQNSGGVQSSNGAQDAMLQYLALLECENTAIGPVPKGGPEK